MRVSRPLFKPRSQSYVALRPLKLKGKVYEAGDELKGLPIFHLRSLYQRRRIGVKGHAWTEQVISNGSFPKLAPKAAPVAEPAKDEAKKPTPKKAPAKKAKAPKKVEPELNDDFDF